MNDTHDDGDDSFQVQSLMGFREALIDAIPAMAEFAKEWHAEHDPKPPAPVDIPVTTVPHTSFEAPDYIALGAVNHLSVGHDLLIA